MYRVYSSGRCFPLRDIASVRRFAKNYYGEITSKRGYTFKETKVRSGLYYFRVYNSKGRLVTGCCAKKIG